MFNKSRIGVTYIIDSRVIDFNDAIVSSVKNL